MQIRSGPAFSAEGKWLVPEKFLHLHNRGGLFARFLYERFQKAPHKMIHGGVLVQCDLSCGANQVFVDCKSYVP
jgi:hypothetical protein